MQNRSPLASLLLPFAQATLLALVLPGCVAVAAGAAGGAGVAYVMGEFEARLDATPPAVVKAAKKALSDLDIEVQTSAVTAVDGKVEARTALDKKLSIKVVRGDDGQSTVRIRIGTWGDETLSRDVYERIKAKL